MKITYKSKSRSSEGSSANVGVDTALSFSSSESAVTLLTPRGVPRVLDDPVWLVTFSTVTDESDTVIELLGVAEEWVHDSAHVSLEPLSVDGSGQRTGGGESSSDGLLVMSDHLPRGNSTLAGEFRGFTGTISALVLVVRLKLEALGLEVLECVLHKTTVATLVFLTVTVDKLLLGEALELLVLEEILTLDVGDG